MNSTGIIRKIDCHGRIVLPIELRRKIGIDVGTPMEIYTDGDRIVLTKYIPATDSSVILGVFERHLDNICVDLGPEKTGDIRKHIRDIRLILN